MHINTKFNINQTVSHTSPSGKVYTGPIRHISCQTNNKGDTYIEYRCEFDYNGHKQYFHLAESQLSLVPRSTAEFCGQCDYEGDRNASVCPSCDTSTTPPSRFKGYRGYGTCSSCIHSELSLSDEICKSCDSSVKPWTNYVYKDDSLKDKKSCPACLHYIDEKFTSDVCMDCTLAAKKYKNYMPRALGNIKCGPIDGVTE